MRPGLIASSVVAIALCAVPVFATAERPPSPTMTDESATEATRAGKAKRPRVPRCPSARAFRRGHGRDGQHHARKHRRRYCGFSGGQARADFNGDGFGDLAVGVPGEDVGGKVDAGAVNVIYGSSAGLGPAGNQLWHQDVANVVDAAEQGVGLGDQFGAALAAADFNNDGFGDLAVGVPGEDLLGRTDAGAFNLIFGSATGLTAAGNQIWDQDSDGIQDIVEPGDNFGGALVWANFGFDSTPDLAVGVPGEGVGGDATAGAVNVIYGGASGLTPANNQSWSQDSPGVPGFSGALDAFGRPLAAGDFDGNGFADLVVGVPNEKRAGAPFVGVVHVIHGSALGLAAGETAAALGVPDAQLWDQEGLDPDGPESGDVFGAALAAGQLEVQDQTDDLAIGAPLEDFGTTTSGQQIGRVHVIFGREGIGLCCEFRNLRQGVFNVPDSSEAGDLFGTAIAIADFDDNGVSELAVGVPGEKVGTALHAGAVAVFRADVAAIGKQFWHQDVPGVPDAAERDDRFGEVITAWDFNGALRDLVVGVPREDAGANADAGGVNVLYGSSLDGLTTAGAQLWHQDQPNILDGSEAGDLFGLTAY